MTAVSGSDRPRALVTGASAGLGMAYAERLARDGHDLILVARRRDRLDALAERLRRDHGAHAQVICADLTDAEALARIETQVAGDEALALLVNNAGFGGYHPFASIEPKVIDELIDIHVRAVARLTRAALPGMIRRGAGGIINVASLLSLSGSLPPVPLPHRATYAAAKAYVLAFSQALAGELNGAGVRIQVCLPGRIDTDFHALQGIDVSKLPPMMKADDVATASLAALARDERVCIPALADPALFDRISEAQVAVFRTAALQPGMAERYRAAGERG